MMKDKLKLGQLGPGESKKIQEDYYNQASQIMTLTRDNQEMAAAIKILEEQNFEYEVITTFPLNYRDLFQNFAQILSKLSLLIVFNVNIISSIALFELPWLIIN